MPSSAVYPMWESILCYNRGCYQKYNPKKNSEDCCQYHPEAPDFRDGKNSWICCNKTFNNLTEFLKTPGCAQGRPTRRGSRGTCPTNNSGFY